MTSLGQFMKLIDDYLILIHENTYKYVIIYVSIHENTFKQVIIYVLIHENTYVNS